MEEIKVDLDEGRIYVDGEWLSADELKYAIKTKISSDDYDVGHLAGAMKELEKIMDESTTIEIRVSNPMYSKLKDMGDEASDTVGAIVRRALEGYMGGDVAPVEEPEEKKPSKKKGRGKKQEEPEEEPEAEPEEDDDELFDEESSEEEEESEPEEEESSEESEDEDLDIEHISRRRRRSSSGSRR